MAKRAKKIEISKRKQFVGWGDQGRQINKEDGSWITYQEEKSIDGCFGAPRGKEGKIGWSSPKNVGQVELGF